MRLLTGGRGFEEIWYNLCGETPVVRSVWCSMFHHDANFCILLVHGHRHTYPDVFRMLKDGVYVVFSSPWLVSARYASRLWELLPLCYDAAAYLRILASSDAEVAVWRAAGFPNVSLVNNACRIDAFMLEPPPFTAAAPQYDVVVNSRLTKFKRHYLTYHIPGVAYIVAGDKLGAPPSCACPFDRVCPDCAHSVVSDVAARIHPTSKMFTNVDATRVRDLLDASKVGVILSDVEGACYASLEYLCRGLPVGSTRSSGGRDAFYTPDNSVICDATPEAVGAAVATALANLRDGTFDPELIRATALRAVADHVAAFRAVTGAIFAREKTPEPGFDRAGFRCRMCSSGYETHVQAVRDAIAAVRTRTDTCDAELSDRISCAVDVWKAAATRAVVTSRPDGTSRPDASQLDAFERALLGRSGTECRQGLDANFCRYPLANHLAWLLNYKLSTMGSQLLLHPDVFGRHMLPEPQQLDSRFLQIVLDGDVGVAAASRTGVVTCPCHALPFPVECDADFVVTYRGVPLWEPADVAPITAVSRTKFGPFTHVADLELATRVLETQADIKNTAKRTGYAALGLCDKQGDLDYTLPVGDHGVESADALEMAVFGANGTPCAYGLRNNLCKTPLHWQLDYLANYLVDEHIGLHGVMDRIATP